MQSTHKKAIQKNKKKQTKKETKLNEKKLNEKEKNNSIEEDYDVENKKPHHRSSATHMDMSTTHPTPPHKEHYSGRQRRCIITPPPFSPSLASLMWTLANRGTSTRICLPSQAIITHTNTDALFAP